MNAMRTLPLDAEFVVIHDPQPAALIEARNPLQFLVWRCHMIFPIRTGQSGFPGKIVSRYDGACFRPGIFAAAPIPQYLFYPAIDRYPKKIKSSNRVHRSSPCSFSHRSQRRSSRKSPGSTA